MDESIFQEKADMILQNLVDAVEIADEQGELDIDYVENVVTIVLPDDNEYVINKHEPTRQIWVSSPFSGAGKYSYDESEDEWMPENGRNLRDSISVEFAKNLNMNVEF